MSSSPPPWASMMQQFLGLHMQEQERNKDRLLTQQRQDTMAAIAERRLDLEEERFRHAEETERSRFHADQDRQEQQRLVDASTIKAQQATVRSNDATARYREVQTEKAELDRDAARLHFDHLPASIARTQRREEAEINRILTEEASVAMQTKENRFAIRRQTWDIMNKDGGLLTQLRTAPTEIARKRILDRSEALFAHDPKAHENLREEVADWKDNPPSLTLKERMQLAGRIIVGKVDAADPQLWEKMTAFNSMMNPDQLRALWNQTANKPADRASMLAEALNEATPEERAQVNKGLAVNNEEPLMNLMQRRAGGFLAGIQRDMMHIASTQQANAATLEMERGLPEGSTMGSKLRPLFSAIAHQDHIKINRQLEKLRDNLSSEESSYVKEMISTHVNLSTSAETTAPTAPTVPGPKAISFTGKSDAQVLFDPRTVDPDAEQRLLAQHLRNPQRGPGLPPEETLDRDHDLFDPDLRDMLQQPPPTRNETSRQKHRRQAREGMEFTAERIRLQREMMRNIVQVGIQQNKGLITSEQEAQETQRLKDKYSDWVKSNRPIR